MPAVTFVSVQVVSVDTVCLTRLTEFAQFVVSATLTSRNMFRPLNPTEPPLVSSLIVGIVHVNVTCPAALVSSVTPVGGAGAVVSAPAAVSTCASRNGL